MKILLDIGNTRLKWALVNAQSWQTQQALVHADKAFSNHILAAWQALDVEPSHLVIACVSLAELVTLLVQVAQSLWPNIRVSMAQAQAVAGGVRNAYPQANKLGVDRWLALLAARQLCQQALCVVDCGTAITLDFMSAEGQHLGGVISPGLMLMKQSLARGTAQLAFSTAHFPAGIAQETEAAIYNGSLFAAAGLIEKMLSLHSDIEQVFLTGGDAELIASVLSIQYQLAPDLVLQGLKVFSDLAQADQP